MTISATYKTQSTHSLNNDTMSKALAGSSNFKALGGARNNELAAWYEQAVAYNRAVENGEAQIVDRAAYQDFLNQMRWAESELNAASSPWGDNIPGAAGSPASGSQENDMGGIAGPDGNWIYDRSDSSINYVADPTRNDVYSFDNTLNIDSASAKVTYSVTNDGGEPVLKVVVESPLGDSVYFYHNYDHSDFKLKINVPDESQVTVDPSITSNIEVGKVGTGTNTSRPESSLAGEEVEGEDNHFVYEGTVGSTIDFYPQGGGANSPTQIHEPYGDANISLKTTDKVEVTKVDPTTLGYDYVLTVTHGDGSKDEFHLRKEFKTNINGIDGYISFDVDGTAGADVLEEGKVPDALKDVFTINGTLSGSTGQGTNPDFAGDTIPDQTMTIPAGPYSNESKKAIYNKSKNVDLHANFEDDITAHDITTDGEVTIHASSFNDTVTINPESDGSYTVLVYRDGQVTDSSPPEVYKITGDVSQIKIEGFLPSKITNHTTSSKINLTSTSQSTNETTTNAQAMIASLLSKTGKSEDQLIRALQGAGFPYTDIDALKQAITDGSFPPKANEAIDAKLVTFIDILDSQFHNYILASKDETQRAQSMKDASSRFVELISTLYPKSNVRVENRGSAADTSPDYPKGYYSIDGNIHAFDWQMDNGLTAY